MECKRLLFLSLILALALASLSFFIQPVQATIYRVQTVRGESTSSSSATATFGNSITTGNVIVVIVGYYGSGTLLSTIESGVSLTERIRSVTYINHHVIIFTGVVSSGASRTITVTLSMAASDIIIDACEYQGVSIIGGIPDLDASATNYGNSAYPSTGITSTTSQASEIWVGGIFAGGYGQSSPTNGFTLIDGVKVAFGSLAYLDKNAFSMGSAESSTTMAASYNWVGAIITLKASVTWHNVETWTIKSYGSDWVNVTISITGSGTTSPAAGFYNDTYRVGDTLTITAYPGVGYTYYGMVRNGQLWTTSNPGVITNLGNVGFQNESIQAIFMEWHDVETWQIYGNMVGSWHIVESWTVRARTTVTWRVVESWTLKVYAPSGFHSVENWTINVIAASWRSAENWTIMVNSTLAWRTIETWNVSVTTTELGFHDIETWTLNMFAAKTVISWDPAMQFYLKALGTYVGFDDTAYFDSFTWNLEDCTYISFTNIYMDNGSPIPSLTISMRGGNVSFGQIDYMNAVSFMFYANQGTIVTLDLTGLDATPYTVIIDGVPMPVDTGWIWDGTTLRVSYIMPASTSHVVLSWAVISTYWHDTEAWDVSLNPAGAIISGITWYYRSNTITTNSITGFEMSDTMDNSLSYVSQNLGVSSDAIQFGFMAYMVNSRNVSVSLTGDVPTAIITRSIIGEGADSATVGISGSALVLGMNSIDVKLYIRLASSTWLLSGEFTSQRLMYTNLIGSSWQFNLYTKMELDVLNNTVASCYWGDTTHNSGISGLSFQTPTPQQIAIFYAGRGDWIHAILYPYMIYAGDGVYGLGFLFVGGVLYLRHKKWEVILVCLFLFGGVGGVGLLIPDAAYRLLYVIVALALTWLLTRVFK